MHTQTSFKEYIHKPGLKNAYTNQVKEYIHKPGLKNAYTNQF